MASTARQLFDLYDDEVVGAAKRIFNTYGGKRMLIHDRLEAVIDYARNVPASVLSNEQMGDVLTLLDEVVTNPAIDDFSEAARPPQRPDVPPRPARG